MLTIRTLTPKDDFDAIGRIYAESWKQSYRGLIPEHYLEHLTSDRWSGMLRADPDASIALFLNNKAVGTASVRFSRDPEREGFGELVSIYLLPGYTGRGFGRRLMDAALDKLRERGCEDTCLWALSGNTRAEGFYEHIGFQRTGRSQRELFGDKTLTLYEYYKSIKK